MTPTDSLRGKLVLLVEDEPIIAIDIADAFACASAVVTITARLRKRSVAERDGLSAAVVDHVLTDGDSSALCSRLNERAVPYLINSGLGGGKYLPVMLA